MNADGEDKTEEEAEEVRSKMESFWKEHSQDASEQEMMLDSNAEVLGKVEIPEILSLLPDITGLDILELGAGIGRFTGLLAERARSVTAVDFMDTFIERNRQLNGHHNNVTFVQADVTKLQLNSASYDMVFSNWLLMYLEEGEVSRLFTNLLSWLRPGGYFFFRESCFHQSGNQSRSSNPTKYRSPATYNALLRSASFHSELVKNTKDFTGEKAGTSDQLNIVDQNVLTNNNNIVSVVFEQREHEKVKGSENTLGLGNAAGSGIALESTYVFEIIMCKSIQTYIKLKSNCNQLCWLLHKVMRTDNYGYRSFQEFLDNHQYSLASILLYESMFGRNFISPGGLSTAQEFSALLKLKHGEKVLDLGCGIGGGAFYIAQEYDVLVTGMDLSANMIAMALERANQIKDKRVQFELGDATKRNFTSESFDAIYSRDTILHIRDKRCLFTSCLRWLRPGGRLIVTDYCCREGEQSVWSPNFVRYVKERGYHLLSILDYKNLLKDVGFVEVMAVDCTSKYINILQTELQRLNNCKEEFIKEFSVVDYDKLVSRWNDKLRACLSGDHKYASFYAEKVTSA